MSENASSTIKRFDATADFWEQKGRREWAYAKNGYGGEHYQNARDAFGKAEQFRNKAETLRKASQTTTTSNVVTTAGIANVVGAASKTGGLVAGGVALAKSVIEGDDFCETSKNVTSSALNGAVSSAAGAAVAEIATKAIMLAPLPTVAKVAIVAGSGIVAGSAASEVVEDICDDIGRTVSNAVCEIGFFLTALF